MRYMVYAQTLMSWIQVLDTSELGSDPDCRRVILYELISCSRFFQRKLTVAQLVKMVFAFHGTQRLITVSTEPCPKPNESNPYPSTAFLVKFLSIYAHVSQHGSLHYLTIILYVFLTFEMRAQCPAHLNNFVLTIQITLLLLLIVILIRRFNERLHSDKPYVALLSITHIENVWQ
jgi:hypothetical protein